MSSDKINPTQWLGSAFAATALLCLLGMAAAFFVKTDGTVLGILFYQVVLSFTFTPALFAVSVPLIWVAWKLLKHFTPTKTMATIFVGLSSIALITCAHLPYFLRGNLQLVPYEFLVVLSGVAVNIAVFAWLVSPPNKSFKRDWLPPAP